MEDLRPHHAYHSWTSVLQLESEGFHGILGCIRLTKPQIRDGARASVVSVRNYGWRLGTQSLLRNHNR